LRLEHDQTLQPQRHGVHLCEFLWYTNSVMKTLTFLVAFVLLTVSLIAQVAPMPQDIPLQKPKLLRDRDNQERSIRIGREPFKTRAIDDTQPKIDDANGEQRIQALELKVKNLEAEVAAQRALINQLQERLDRLQQKN
jgi:hypothetical protein